MSKMCNYFGRLDGDTGRYNCKVSGDQCSYIFPTNKCEYLDEDPKLNPYSKVEIESLAKEQITSGDIQTKRLLDTIQELYDEIEHMNWITVSLKIKTS